MEKKKYERSQEQACAQRLFYKIQICCGLIAFLLLFVDWRYALAAAGVLAWNGCFYTSGCQSLVVDEYEQDGYPTYGLERMFRSWIWLVVCLALVYFLL